MKNLKDESGQALVITFFCMTCLFGFVGLAADVGVMLREERLVQTAADSAAIAGALELKYNLAGVSTAAQAAATQNGFTDGSNGASVTINAPPSSGPHARTPGYVEAIISQVQPTLFLGFFGRSSQTVSARAVAVNGGSAFGCVYVLSPTASPAMDLSGSFDMTAPNCGVIVDSSANGALHFTGAAGTLTAGSVGVVGTATGHTGDSTPAPVQGIVPQSDPLAGLPGGTPPDPTKLTCNAAPGNKLTGPQSDTGVVCYSGNVTLSNVILGSATYVFTGNVTLGGTVSTPVPTSASPSLGSTIDINNGSLSINTGTTLSLYAPHSGTYNGIVLMQPPANANQILIQKGDSTGTLDGIIYAPGANLKLQDSGGDKSGGVTLITDLIVGTLQDNTATFNIQSYSQSTGTSPISKVTLVE